MNELGAVTHCLAKEENRLNKLPSAITKMKEELKAPVNEAIHFHKQVKTIQGMSDEDKKNKSTPLIRFACERYRLFRTIWARCNSAATINDFLVCKYCCRKGNACRIGHSNRSPPMYDQLHRTYYIGLIVRLWRAPFLVNSMFMPLFIQDVDPQDLMLHTWIPYWPMLMGIHHRCFAWHAILRLDWFLFPSGFFLLLFVSRRLNPSLLRPSQTSNAPI